MNVKQLIAELSALPEEAHVVLIDEETGVAEEINRVCESEDPPVDGSAEVWIIKEME